ncbi:MAG: hypothetical protein GY851_10570 [bacterium]|nr:hypothetical protein [bacterium]
MDAKKKLENTHTKIAEIRDELSSTQQDLRLSEEQRSKGLRAQATGNGDYSDKAYANDSHTVDMLRSRVSYLREQLAILEGEILQLEKNAGKQAFEEIVARAVAKAKEESDAWRHFVEQWNLARDAWLAHSERLSQWHVLVEHDGRQALAKWEGKELIQDPKIDPGIRQKRSEEFHGLQVRHAVTGMNPKANLLMKSDAAADALNGKAGMNSNGGFRFDSLEQPAERE